MCGIRHYQYMLSILHLFAMEWRSYPMFVLLLPLVAAILFFNRFYPLETHPTEEQVFGFIVQSAPTPTAKCERFETQVLPKGKVYLYLLRDSTKALPTYGDTVVARTHIEWNRSVGRAFAAEYILLPAKTHRVPLQVRLYQRLASAGLEDDELATVGALTLGYKEDLDPELKHHFQASGAAHVLAVSGLHTGILYGLLLWILTFGGRIKPLHENRVGRWAISSVIIVAMWGYAWLTGMTPSVVRAVLMVTIFEIGRMCYRQVISLNTIAAAAVLILLVHPTDLWSVSFQLSFAATFSIVLFAKQLEPSLQRLGWREKWRGKIVSYFLGTIIVSIAAQIGTMPITMYYFGQVSTYFLLTNLIVLPIATFLVPCGLISIALGGSTIGVLFSKITWFLAWAMNHSVEWIEELPGSTVSASVNGVMVGIYYLLLLFLYAIIAKKRT